MECNFPNCGCPEQRLCMYPPFNLDYSALLRSGLSSEFRSQNKVSDLKATDEKETKQ